MACQPAWQDSGGGLLTITLKGRVLGLAIGQGVRDLALAGKQSSNGLALAVSTGPGAWRGWAARLSKTTQI